MKSFCVAAVTLVAFVIPAAAQHVGIASARQEGRIIAGERSGALSRGEAMHLQAQQNRIDATISRERAQNGGYLTASERASIHERQEHANMAIYRDKHNDVVR